MSSGVQHMAEERTDSEYKVKSKELGWNCIPLAVEVYEHGVKKPFSQLALCIADCTNGPNLDGQLGLTIDIRVEVRVRVTLISMV